MKEAAKNFEELYTMAEVASLLKCSRRNVARLRDRGRTTNGADGLWPVVLVCKGKRGLRFPASTIEKFLKQRTA